MSVSINLPGGPKDGEEINVEETLDRWSEIKLSDGNKLKIKQTIIKVIKIIDNDQPDHWAKNADGTIMYAVISNPVVITG